MPTTYREIEESLVAQIAALDASAHAQGGSAAWRESRVPLSVVMDPSSLSHLLFNVWVQRAPVSPLGSRQGEIAGEVYLRATLVVAFSYRLRATNQVADARAATDAAVDVTRAVMASGAAGDALVVFVDGLNPALALDGEWQLVTQTYEVHFDLALSRST
ncbi:MAG: hypothetical protein AAF602_12295 [Myxococcota bacterium]